ncbi:malate dehydrogenase (quinone) [Nocardia yunnanensis]|uniref:Probable malate:quinone oxidoreductase n=1 Tax=Nocardia yunnanensis TaxID=2382165 RepID=A0A386Z938_9NOCA|nr:malate dehydrogenase (quinone) [Nocardia yunnanensis]AYF73614.1 malate dehydrogenase (quinone) [Nocardia yunnanensis]
MTARTQLPLRPYDVVLIGGGIMSATLAVLLKHLEPSWTIAVYERLPEVGAEASAAFNNSGTGHAGLCELDYTSENPDGSVDIEPAVALNEQFQLTRQLLASLVESEVLRDPSTFINPVPHLTLARGKTEVDFLRRRHETLSAHHLFANMRFSDDPTVIGEWAPLLTAGRDESEPIAATCDITGSDIDFGELTGQLFHWLRWRDVEIHRNCEVRGLRRNNDGTWQLRVDWRTDNDRLTRKVDARFVFAGAGGWALKILQKAGLPEAHGYGLFPVSGRFLRCDNPEVVAAHTAKVYGRGPAGAPSISMPHLDTRVVHGERALLFGPFPGANPRFLKRGSLFDAPAALRPDNVAPMLAMLKQNRELAWLLFSQMFATRKKKLAALREFVPEARAEDWTLISAGQRAQIVKPDDQGGGVLEFGTEVVAARDGSIAAVLGATPGASTAPVIMLEVLERCFPRYAALWEPRLRALMPTLGHSLARDARLARQTMAATAATLRLEGRVVG